MGIGGALCHDEWVSVLDLFVVLVLVRLLPLSFPSEPTTISSSSCWVIPSLFLVP